MFLVIRDTEPEAEHVLVFEDPRSSEPGFPAEVVEAVSVERSDCTADWPYGFTPPAEATLGQHPADPKRFKVFDSEQLRNEGRFLKPATEPRGPYRSWMEYLRERVRKAA